MHLGHERSQVGVVDPARRAHGDAIGEPAVAVAQAGTDLGRVAPDADPDAVAALLAGACFQQAFLRYFAAGPDAPPAPDTLATALTHTLTRALEPRP